MFIFSRRSLRKLSTCHPKLQELMICVLNRNGVSMDFSVLEGHRGKIRQNLLYYSGSSQVKYPNSRHNSKPSMAIDIAPYPIDWKDIERFHELAELVKIEAERLNIKIVWGGDWKFFKDYVHFQLMED